MVSIGSEHDAGLGNVGAYDPFGFLLRGEMEVLLAPGMEMRGGEMLRLDPLLSAVLHKRLPDFKVPVDWFFLCPHLLPCGREGRAGGDEPGRYAPPDHGPRLALVVL